MMIENHLRHVKPSEFNRSVIWASRIGLFLLIFVAVLATVPLVAQKVQKQSLETTFLNLKDSISNSNFPGQVHLEFVNNTLDRLVSPTGSYIASGIKRTVDFSAELSGQNEIMFKNPDPLKLNPKSYLREP